MSVEVVRSDGPIRRITATSRNGYTITAVPSRDQFLLITGPPSAVMTANSVLLDRNDLRRWCEAAIEMAEVES